jgi:hypothetical protein
VHDPAWLVSIFQGDEGSAMVESLIVTEATDQEAARIINAISCAYSKGNTETAIHYGRYTYQVKLGKVISFLDFDKKGSLATDAFKNATLTISVSGYGNEGGFFAYKELKLKLTEQDYKFEDRLLIPADYGGLIFRFSNVTDETTKRDVYKWLVTALGKDGQSNLIAINNGTSWKAEDVRLFSECQLEQLSRDKRKELIVDLLAKLKIGYGLVNDHTNQYLLVNVLKSTPAVDRSYFYNEFKNNPKWVLSAYADMANEPRKKFVTLMLAFWQSVERTSDLLAANECVIKNSIFGNPSLSVLNLATEGELVFNQNSSTSIPQLAFKAGPFTPVSITSKSGGENFTIVPALMLKFMADKGSSDDLKDLGWATVNVALFTVGVGEVVQGVRLTATAVRAGEKFLLRSFRVLLGASDLVASTASGYCGLGSNGSSEFCKAWAEYELYVNLGLLSVSTADLVFAKLQKGYREIPDLTSEQRKVLEDGLGLSGKLNLGGFVKRIGDYEVFENGEVFYRGMTKSDYDFLVANKKLQVTSSTSEMFTSPSLEYIKSVGYGSEGVIVKIQAKPGTLHALEVKGIRDQSTRAGQLYPNMPNPEKPAGWMERGEVYFKTETIKNTDIRQVNIGLGRNTSENGGLKLFNDNILGFEIVE